MMTLKVKFNYSLNGEIWRPIVKDVAEKKLIESWHRFCEYANPKLETWNNEFSRLFPGVKGDTELYERFMRSKYQPFYDKLNSENENSREPIRFAYRIGSDFKMIEIVKVNGIEFDVYFTLEEEQP